MFGSLGAPEILVIFVVALIVFGPSKLPEFGKSLGEAIRGFKSAINDAAKSPIESPQPPVKTAQASNPPARIEDKA